MKDRSISRRKATQLVLAAPMVSSVFFLNGCKSATVTPVAMTAIGAPIPLGISSIDIINEYTAPGAKPYIDHILNPNPIQQVTDWASDILTPADARGNLLITITRAAMTEEHLEGEESIKGFFTNEQTRKVRIELKAYFSFGHPQNNRSATLTVQAAYETTIAENTTPRDADLIRKAVMEEGMGKFDAEFRRQLDMVSGGGWPKI